MIRKSCKLAHDRILARGEFVQLGIFEVEVPLAHRAFHVRDGVAHHAAQSGLRFGTVHDLLDRSIHQAAVEHGRIVASAAPFRRLGADRVLHVLDDLAIPLIVERREMVGRAVPLVVDVFVAALAGVGLHEELAGNLLLAIDLRGTGKEVAVGAVAFAVHGVGRHGRIFDAIARLPTLADVTGTDSRFLRV